jgi:HTH-type transcriptional regulator / antitoxin HipB
MFVPINHSWQSESPFCSNLQAGITPESLSRFERGRGAELGTRKLLAILAVLDMELDIVASPQRGTLDELRVERSQP